MNLAYYVVAISAALVTLIGTAVAIGVAWGVVIQWQKSHEQRDAERFLEQGLMLKEMRDDIKTLLTTR